MVEREREGWGLEKKMYRLIKTVKKEKNIHFFLKNLCQLHIVGFKAFSLCFSYTGILRVCCSQIEGLL